MSQKTKKILLMIVIYAISLFLFELIIGNGNFEKVEHECIEKGYYTPFPYFTSFIEAGIYHFIVVTIIAIICKFNKKIGITYKKVIYIFPFLTFIFSLPMMIPTTLFARAFHLYGF